MPASIPGDTPLSNSNRLTVVSRTAGSAYTLPTALAAEAKLGVSALSAVIAPVVSGVSVVVMRRFAEVVSGKVPGRKT